MITNMILIICSIIFFYICFKKEDKTHLALKLGALYPPYVIEDKQYYRLITSAFIHVDLMHFIFNMYFIYQLGSFFESLFGSVLYFVLVFISLLCSSYMCITVAKINDRSYNTLTIGASGIGYGYLGALLALAFIIGGPFMNLLQNMAGMILINIALTCLHPRISKAGHLGGMIGGVLSTVIIIFGLQL